MDDNTDAELGKEIAAARKAAGLSTNTLQRWKREAT